MLHRPQHAAQHGLARAMLLCRVTSCAITAAILPAGMCGIVTPPCMQARQQVKEMVWMKQSENMVLEAMAHLSAVHDALEDMLMGSQHSARSPDHQLQPLTSASQAAGLASHGSRRFSH